MLLVFALILCLASVCQGQAPSYSYSFTTVGQQFSDSSCRDGGGIPFSSGWTAYSDGHTSETEMECTQIGQYYTQALCVPANFQGSTNQAVGTILYYSQAGCNSADLIGGGSAQGTQFGTDCVPVSGSTGGQMNLYVRFDDCIDDSNDSGSSGGMPTGTKAGIAIGVLLVVGICILGVFFYRKRQISTLSSAGSTRSVNLGMTEGGGYVPPVLVQRSDYIPLDEGTPAAKPAPFVNSTALAGGVPPAAPAPARGYY